MRVKPLTLLLLAALLCLPIPTPASAAEIIIDEADLSNISPSSNLFQINLDAQNQMIVSDEWGFIWSIDPLSGAYTYYDTVISSLTDAHKLDTRYIFTDNVNGIGYANISTKKTAIWLYDNESSAAYSFGALAIDGQGGIWIADYWGPDTGLGKGGRIYKFSLAGTPSAPTAEICPLPQPPMGEGYETWAYDLVLYDNFLWYYNWKDDLIYRFNPTLNAEQYELKYWATGIPAEEGENEAIEGRVLAFDSNGLLWIPGGASRKIMSFDPDSQILTTYTVPTLTASIEGITTLDGKIWYADLHGSAGILDPSQANGVESGPLDSTTLYLPFSPGAQCVSLGTVTPGPINKTETGTLTFSDRAITPTSPETGWTVYPLTAGDALNGINAAQGTVFITDTYTEQITSARLLRFRTGPGDHKLFLPAILR